MWVYTDPNSSRRTIFLLLILFILAVTGKPARNPVLFVNATEKAFDRPAGFGDVKRQGVAVLDFYNDGYEDLFFPGFSKNVLFKNNGNMTFTDVSEESGVAADRPIGTSAVAADLDNDGDSDLVVGHGLVEGDNLDGSYDPKQGGLTIFENQLSQTGKSIFKDITTIAFPTREYPGDGRFRRYVTMVAAADVDGDGFIDLYQSNRSDRDFENYREKKHRGAKNILWHNRGVGGNGSVSFENITLTASPDGTLAGVPHPTGHDPSPGILGLTIDAKGRIAGDSLGNITQAALFTDIDNDADPDLIIANDFPDSFEIFRNDSADGVVRFTRITGPLSTMGGWMGIDSADVDGDGDFDLFLTNVGATNARRWSAELLRNTGAGFEKIGTQVSIIPDPLVPNNDPEKKRVDFSAYEYGWGASFLDAENDGDPDLFYFGSPGSPSFFMQSDTDASILSMRAVGGKTNPGRFFRNDGGSRWAEITKHAGVLNLYRQEEGGLLVSENGSGLATGDFNNDGALDLVLANGSMYWGKQATHPALLFLNRGSRNRFLSVTLEGTTSNRSAVGARVFVTTGGKMQVKEVKAGVGFASGSTLVLHFGLGRARVVDKLIVRWPNRLVNGKTVQGKTQELRNVTTNRMLRIREPEGDHVP